MTHTEKSLMALVESYANHNKTYDGVKRNAISVAIREVLAEVDRADYATRRAVERAEKAEAALFQMQEAAKDLTENLEKAEAECERLRSNGARVIASLCDACLLKLNAMKEQP